MGINVKTDKELLYEDAWNIRYVEQTEENIKHATEMCFSALLCVNQTEELCLWAVGQNGYTIRYIKNPSEKVKLAAVRNWGHAIKYIQNPSEKVQLVAVRSWGYVIQYIKNPSEKVIAAANKAKSN